MFMVYFKIGSIFGRFEGPLPTEDLIGKQTYIPIADDDGRIAPLDTPSSVIS